MSQSCCYHHFIISRFRNQNTIVQTPLRETCFEIKLNRRMPNGTYGAMRGGDHSPYSIVFLFPSVPAVGAELAGIESESLGHVIQTVIVERCEIQLAADLFAHGAILLRVRIGIAFQYLLRGILCLLKLLYLAPRDQFHLGI